MLTICLSAVAEAQEIAGSWRGNYSGFLSGIMSPNELVVDIMISDDTVVTGTSHLYYDNDKYEHYFVSGIFHPTDSTISFSEDSTINKNVGITCLGKYTMRLKLTDSTMRFEGRWRDNSDNFILFRCPSSGVWLEKKIPKKKKPIRDRNLDRKPEIQKMIEISQDMRDSIKVELLDNSEVDNDVVSVYVDDSLALSKKTLTAQPTSFYIKIDENARICRIKLAAESMGTTPPCTALMVITTRDGRKQNVILTSNFGTNGVLELFLK